MLFEHLTVRPKKSTIFYLFYVLFFCFILFFWMALLLKMASSLPYLPAASPSPPPPPRLLFLHPSLTSSPLLSLPVQRGGSPGLRLVSLHPIRIACRACDVTYVFDLSYAWTDMWTGCGGVSKRGNGGGGQFAPATEATACWSRSSCTETQQAKTVWEGGPKTLSLSPHNPLHL